MSGAPPLEVHGVSRWIGACCAVDRADLTLLGGELHALVGENGAGKSTLLKIAAGAVVPDEGGVRVAGAALDPPSAAEAMRRGVGLVYQHFMLVGAFRVLENLILGAEPVRRAGRLDLASARAKAEALMRKTGLDLPLDAVTDELGVGQKQRLEILRVLYRGARVVLLDEPTAVLTPLEAEDLYATLRRLADDGAAIVVVTHRLDEVVRHADRVTVMRRGRVVHHAARADGPLDERGLTAAIMGHEAPEPAARPAARPDARTVLELRGVRAEGAGGLPALDALDLDVRAGEIVGVAGVEGNGQRELALLLAGLLQGASGTLKLAGRGRPLDEGARARRDAVGVVLEDRHAEGLVLSATVGDNLVLGDLGDPHRAGFDERAVARARSSAFHVVPPDLDALASDLSGGNQQKVVVARAIDRVRPLGERGLLVIAQPTRGVDIGAAAQIHSALFEAALAGLGVLVISADLAELRRIAHRILVLRKGRVVADLSPEASEAEIGRAMLGLEAA